MRYRKIGKVPVKRILDGYGYNEDIWDSRYWNTGTWHQLNEPDETIHPIVESILGVKLGSNVDCILHIGNESIESHRDRMSSRIYIIPIRWTSTMRFFEDGIEKPFKAGHAILFDDHLSHGLLNDHRGKFILMSVSFGY
jgi:hypothetical protein